MPKQIMITAAIEGTLIFLTTFLLTQPTGFFKTTSEKAKTLATYSGLIFLCITFCWSVILGCLVALREFPFRI